MNPRCDKALALPTFVEKQFERSSFTDEPFVFSLSGRICALERAATEILVSKSRRPNSSRVAKAGACRTRHSVAAGQFEKKNNNKK